MNNSSRRPDREVRPEAIPGATYRLQFHHDFTLLQGCEIVDYLRDLGITHCYASPLFLAGPGSIHGYDVCDFAKISPELGGRTAFDQFSGRLHELGLGLILDMVPNHMSVDPRNRWWMDVLENGPASAFADFFDINWELHQFEMRNQVILPILEDHYARVLESGKLQLEFQDGGFYIDYQGKPFPIAARSYGAILNEIAAALEEFTDPEKSILAEIRACTEESDQDYQSPKSVTEKCRYIQQRLRDWHERSAQFKEALARVRDRYNGQPGKPGTFDSLHHLLHEQHYRLVYWKIGPEEINYRRFFEITSLISIRVELPEVFRATHQLVFELIDHGQVTGLRIDHPDGLWNPKEYFQRLQTARLETEKPEPRAQPNRRLYVVAEKILSETESLPADWPVDGTTGYDFLNEVNGLFVNNANERRFEQVYQEFSRDTAGLKDRIRFAKMLILETSLISELNVLTDRAKKLAEKSRYAQDLTRTQIRNVLAEIIASFPVYRTYVTAETTELASDQQAFVQCAIDQAQSQAAGVEQLAFDFLRNLLLLHFPKEFIDEVRTRAKEFVMRFQQLTGPVAAKGVEDTTFYNFNRLISLNEVGGSPAQFGSSPERFHEFNLNHAATWPDSLLATATHDTKRGEDVRARINVLSELPGEWHSALQRWSRMNSEKKSRVQGEPAPHPNDEYLLYQTLVGTWPDLPPLKEVASPSAHPDLPNSVDLGLFRKRITTYMIKAVRESKSHTSWIRPNAAYEAAVESFAELILNSSTAGTFLQDFIAFERRIAFFGQVNSLAQLLLKVTSPGIPDFYQGNELWDLNLVDPDNRRPIDYSLRRQQLHELHQALNRCPEDRGHFIAQLLAESATGKIKLFVTSQSLAVRQQHRSLFDEGDYCPLRALGPNRAHVCAFGRVLMNKVIIVAVPRLACGLTRGRMQLPLGHSVWQNTSLDLASLNVRGQFRNLLTNEVVKVESGARPELPLAEVLASFPVALLEPAA